jgi:hypothetical protein
MRYLPIIVASLLSASVGVAGTITCGPTVVKVAHKVIPHARPKVRPHRVIHRRARPAPETRIVYLTPECSLPVEVTSVKPLEVGPVTMSDFARIAVEAPNEAVGPGSTPNVLFSPPVVPAAAPAVPEPATWGMFIAGFGMVGLMLRSTKAVHA